MSRYHDIPSVQLRFEWNPNAVRGFIAASIIMAIVLLVSMCTRYTPPEPYSSRRTTPFELMVFGEGDGTGGRKGNLSREGASQRGKETQNPLEDAQRSASSSGKVRETDPTQSAKLIPAKNIGKDGKPHEGEAADRTVGTTDGKDDASGLGWVGTGTGKGLGNEAIDWGGGGNRTVVSNPLPKFPPGTMNTAVKLKFRVLSDGSVSLVWPVRKGGNPIVDQEAMRVLKQWRFNKLSSGVEMEGTITFVFKNS